MGTTYPYEPVDAYESAPTTSLVESPASDAFELYQALPAFNAIFYPDTNDVRLPETAWVNVIAVDNGSVGTSAQNPTAILIALAAAGRNPTDITLPTQGTAPHNPDPDTDGDACSNADVEWNLPRLSQQPDGHLPGDVSGNGSSGASSSGIWVAQGALSLPGGMTTASPSAGTSSATNANGPAAAGGNPTDTALPTQGTEASGGEEGGDAVLGGSASGSTSGSASSGSTSDATSDASTTSSPSSSSGTGGASGEAATGSSAGATASSAPLSNAITDSSTHQAGTSGPDDIEPADDPPPAQGSHLAPGDPLSELPPVTNANSAAFRPLQSSAGQAMAGDLRVMGAAANGFQSGLMTGGKAVVNGTASAVRATVTLGLVGDHWEVIAVTPGDRANGYATAAGVVQITGEFIIGAATGGAASGAGQGRAGRGRCR